METFIKKALSYVLSIKNFWTHWFLYKKRWECELNTKLTQILKSLFLKEGSLKIPKKKTRSKNRKS